jgi:uncharacterized membrane protein YagU involved in acid resistance
MSTTTVRLPDDVSATDVSSVVVAAVLGSVAFGIVMSLMLGEVLLTAIPAMYGLEGVSRSVAVLVGWAIHISHGTVLGLCFGVAVTIVPTCGERLRFGFLAGVAYGIVLWVALASILMPVWVGTVTPMDPPVPDWQFWSLLGHVIYGAFLGLLIPLYRRHE